MWSPRSRNNNLGMWLSGRAFALHVKGPGFDPRHLHLHFFVNFHDHKMHSELLDTVKFPSSIVVCRQQLASNDNSLTTGPILTRLHRNDP